MKLRALSYNIHKGFSSMNRGLVIHEIREAIRATSADLVFLQEVIGHHLVHRNHHNRWPNEPQFEFLADTTWNYQIYGKNAIYDEGHHGNALLSKYPFTKWENIDVSNNRRERRGILHGIINLPEGGKPLHAICVHLDLFEIGRTRQLEKICERVSSQIPESEPLIIAGDFNDWRKRATDVLESQLKVKEVFLQKTGEHAKTFPTWLPGLALDRIYTRGCSPVVVRRLDGAKWRRLSDHLPLLAEVELQRYSAKSRS